MDGLARESAKYRWKAQQREFGERVLKPARMRQGRTQISIGDEVGVDQPFISKVEKGDHPPGTAIDVDLYVKAYKLTAIEAWEWKSILYLLPSYEAVIGLNLLESGDKLEQELRWEAALEMYRVAEAKLHEQPDDAVRAAVMAAQVQAELCDFEGALSTIRRVELLYSSTMSHESKARISESMVGCYTNNVNLMNLRDFLEKVLPLQNVSASPG